MNGGGCIISKVLGVLETSIFRKHTLKQFEVCFVMIAKFYDSYFVMVVFSFGM